jgi:hypothetical protein
MHSSNSTVKLPPAEPLRADEGEAIAPDSAGERLIRFSRRAVVAHMRRHHPGCPAEICRAIVCSVVTRSWSSATIGAAVGIVAHNMARHELTEYEFLLKQERIPRAEARRKVAGQVNDIIRSWARAPCAGERATEGGPAPADDESPAARERAPERRFVLRFRRVMPPGDGS